MDKKIYTDITDPLLTKLAKYMFFIEISIYERNIIEQAFEDLQPRIGETFDPINVYIADTNSKDYDLQENLDNDQDDQIFMYHVLVDTTNPRFKESLDTLKTAYSFVDCYQCQNSKSDKAIIRQKVVVKRRVVQLLESRYSEMYAEREYKTILNNVDVTKRFTIWDKETKKDVLDKSLHVLMKSQELFDKMVNDLGLTDDDTREILSGNEFDTKYDLKKETINSKELV